MKTTTTMTTDKKWKLVIGFETLEELEREQKLYKAAPDLYEALEEMVRVFKPVVSWHAHITAVSKSREAIKKATE